LEYAHTGDQSESVIKIVGNLSFEDHTAWREMFEFVLGSKPDKITLDLTELITFDSAALGLILIFQAKAVNEQTDFEIIQPETGYLKYALNCTDISCVPGLDCATKQCPEQNSETEPTSKIEFSPDLDADIQPRMDSWASVFGPIKVSSTK